MKKKKKNQTETIILYSPVVISLKGLSKIEYTKKNRTVNKGEK